MRETEYVDLQALSKILGLSVRTIRTYINDPLDPLPAIRLSGKLIVSVRALGDYLDRHQVQPPNIDSIVNETIQRFHRTEMKNGPIV